VTQRTSTVPVESAWTGKASSSLPACISEFAFDVTVRTRVTCSHRYMRHMSRLLKEHLNEPYQTPNFRLTGLFSTLTTARSRKTCQRLIIRSWQCQCTWRTQDCMLYLCNVDQCSKSSDCHLLSVPCICTFL